MGRDPMTVLVTKTLLVEPIDNFLIVRPQYTIQNLYGFAIDVDTVWSCLNDGAKYDAIPADDINNLASMASTTITKGLNRKTLPSLGQAILDALQAQLTVKRTSDQATLGTEYVQYALTVAGKFGNPTRFDFDGGASDLQGWTRSDVSYVINRVVGSDPTLAFHSNPYCWEIQVSNSWIYLYRNVNFLALGTLTYAHLRAWYRSWNQAGSGATHYERFQLWDVDLGSLIQQWEWGPVAPNSEAAASWTQRDVDIMSLVQGNDNVQLRVGARSADVATWLYSKLDDIEVDCLYA